MRRADVIRQKSEAVRHLASQLIEEHEDYARYKTADQIKQGHEKGTPSISSSKPRLFSQLFRENEDCIKYRQFFLSSQLIENHCDPERCRTFN